MIKLNEKMSMSELATTVMNALKSSTKADFSLFHWTFTGKGGDEQVEFIFSKNESRYVLTRAKKFLFFTVGHESVTLSSNSPNLDMAIWHQLGDVLHNTAARFGENA